MLIIDMHSCVQLLPVLFPGKRPKRVFDKVIDTVSHGSRNRAFGDSVKFQTTDAEKLVRSKPCATGATVNGTTRDNMRLWNCPCAFVLFWRHLCRYVCLITFASRGKKKLHRLVFLLIIGPSSRLFCFGSCWAIKPDNTVPLRSPADSDLRCVSSTLRSTKAFLEDRGSEAEAEKSSVH